MTTYEDMLADIKGTLGLGIDDAEWDDGAILYNIRLAVDKLKQQDLGRHQKNGDLVRDMNEVSTFLVPLATDTTFTDRRYFDMPGPTYSLPVNGGIDHIAYFRNGLPPNCDPQIARVQYTHTTWRELSFLKDDPLQKPSQERPRYIRTPTKTYVFGQDPQITQVEVGLFLSMPALEDIVLTAEIPLEAGRLFDLRRLLLSTGNWLMLQPQERLLNDGRANNVGQPVQPTQPAMSVNDPILTERSE